MRKIKFRGLQENGIWRYGDFAYKDEERATIFPKVKRFGEVVNGVSVPLNTVGQFVGFEDTNEVEIYEGDILGKELHSNLEVKFKDGLFVAERNEYDGLFIFAAVERGYEVVGNIYENKELLHE